jgi:hypothetical protein
MADWARFARWLYERTAKDHARRNEDAHLCSPPTPNKRRADASPGSADGCLLHQSCRDGPFALLRAWRQNAQTIESVNGPSHYSSCKGERAAGGTIMFRFLFKMTLHVAVVAIVITVASQMGLFRYVHLPFDLPSVNVSALASPLLGCHCARHESPHFGRNE